MKNRFAIILIVISFNASAQKQFPTDSLNRIVYTEIVNDSGTATELYKKGVRYFAESFNSANDVIQLNDSASKEIIGKGNIAFLVDYHIGNSDPAKSYLSFTVKLNFKEKRYKYCFSQFKILNAQNEQLLEELMVPAQTEKQNQVRNEMISSIQNKIDALILQLKNFMASNEVTKNDW